MESSTTCKSSRNRANGSTSACACRFIAGNDADAKQRVRALLGDFAWSVIDIGDIHNARWLEAMSLLWVVYHHQTGKLNHAFKLLGN